MKPAPSEIVGLASIARVLAEAWHAPVTSFAVSVLAVLSSDPLPLVRRGRHAAAKRAVLLGWAERQARTRPRLVEFAAARGPRTDKHLSVRGFRDLARDLASPPAAAPPAPPAAPPEEDPPMHATCAAVPVSIAPTSPPLSGLGAVHEYLAARRPCAPSTVEKWIRRPHDPLPVRRFGAGSKMVARREEIDAWLEREERRAERARRLRAGGGAA